MRSFQFGRNGENVSDPSVPAQDRIVWDAYSMRDQSSTTPAGLACPIVSADAAEVPAPPTSITLEPDDGVGYGYGIKYSPVVMLPENSYATLAFEIVDVTGAVVLPAMNVWLGPDDYFPWTIDAITAPAPQVGSDPLSPPPPMPPGVARLQAPPSLPASTGRRLGQNHPSRTLLFGELGVPLSTPADADADDADLSSATRATAPGSRRLLKGGTSGGTSSAGRSGSTGSSRWGSSASSVTTRSGYTSGARAAAVTSSGRRYGGSTTYAYTSRGGYHYHYYAGYRSYRYSMASRVLLYGSTFYVVRHYAYGCYTCRTRTCYACGSCTSRKACGGEVTTNLPTSLDRYEIDLESPLEMPSRDKFPLQLRVLNLTQFFERGAPSASGQQAPSSGSSEVYMTFYTAAPKWDKPINDTLATLGWIGLFFCVTVMCCSKESLFPESDGSKRQHIRPSAHVPVTSTSSASMQPQHHMCGQPQMQIAQPVAQPVAQAVAYPSQGVAYPAQPYGAQNYVAQPYVAQAQPVQAVAYPAQPYPGQGGYAMPVAYPSNPPSPPADRGKDE